MLACTQVLNIIDETVDLRWPVLPTAIYQTRATTFANHWLRLISFCKERKKEKSNLIFHPNTMTSIDCWIDPFSFSLASDLDFKKTSFFEQCFSNNRSKLWQIVFLRNQIDNPTNRWCLLNEQWIHNTGNCLLFAAFSIDWINLWLVFRLTNSCQWCVKSPIFTD